MYEDLQFPVLPARPFFYTNFVATIDGKVDVPARHAEYWPIGTPADYAELIHLRVHADALIHGRRTAMSYRTVESLAKPQFREARRVKDKSEDLLYIIVSDHPDQELYRHLENTVGVQTLVTGGTELSVLAADLKQKGIDHVLVEGGPHLLASFFAADLIDEIFLTIAPKVFGGSAGTLTMAEGLLLPPDQIKKWKLVSMAAVEDEVFLRYRAS